MKNDFNMKEEKEVLMKYDFNTNEENCKKVIDRINAKRETLTEEKYLSLSKEAKEGNKQSLETLEKLSYLTACEQVVNIFIDNGTPFRYLEDSLSETFFAVFEYCHSTENISKDYEDYKSSLCENVVASLKQKFETLKESNADYNFSEEQINRNPDEIDVDLKHTKIIRDNDKTM